MFTKIADTVKSRQFQNGAGQLVIAVTTLVVTSVVSNAVSKGMNTGLQAILDKVHGAIETPKA